MSPGTTLRLLNASSNAVPRAGDEPQGEPYAVERFPAVRGGVLLVGYDGRGRVMLELRIPQQKFSERMVERMRRWLRDHDDALSLLR